MRTRLGTAALIAALGWVFRAGDAQAQPNLPPPPPPPIDEPTEVPSLPPPPATGPSPRSPSTPSTRRATQPPAPPYRPPPPARVRRYEEVEYVEPPPAHPVAITFNPLGLPLGRLSANAEVGLLPHHSIIAAPYGLIFHVNRGGPQNLASEGFGFASPSSGGVGIEVGYHYWLEGHRSLRGGFFGPSLIVGGTSNAAVGDPTHEQPYFGLAFDLGYQEVLSRGFTLGVGAGVELIQMAGTGAVVPRALLQVGYSF